MPDPRTAPDRGTLPLSGRTALVTGGSRGVGRAVALRLLVDGGGPDARIVAESGGGR